MNRTYWWSKITEHKSNPQSTLCQSSYARISFVWIAPVVRRCWHSSSSKAVFLHKISGKSYLFVALAIYVGWRRLIAHLKLILQPLICTTSCVNPTKTCKVIGDGSWSIISLTFPVEWRHSIAHSKASFVNFPLHYFLCESNELQ
jgi:hypothetical protein